MEHPIRSSGFGQLMDTQNKTSADYAILNIYIYIYIFSANMYIEYLCVAAFGHAKIQQKQSQTINMIGKHWNGKPFLYDVQYDVHL